MRLPKAARLSRPFFCGSTEGGDGGGSENRSYASVGPDFLQPADLVVAAGAGAAMRLMPTRLLPSMIKLCSAIDVLCAVSPNSCNASAFCQTDRKTGMMPWSITSSRFRSASLTTKQQLQPFVLLLSTLSRSDDEYQGNQHRLVGLALPQTHGPFWPGSRETR